MKEKQLELFLDGNPENPVHFTVKRILNAGYTGRNQEEVRKHIEELKAMGVPAPEKTPTYFPKAAALITTDDYVEVVDEDSTGEAEYVLLIAKDEIYVAAGSDHTDRKLEETNIPKAKQLCPNFISRSIWKLNDVQDHWDELILRSWIGEGRSQLYQEAYLEALLSPDALLERVRPLITGDLVGTVIYSGTVATLVEGMPFSETFDMELFDAQRGQRLCCRYRIKVMDWFQDQ